jgi:hypothetical protein
MFYHGAAIYHLFISDLTRVDDVTRIHAVPPDHGCQVNPTLKPIFRSAGMGEEQQ